MSNLTQGVVPQPYGQGGRKVDLPVQASAQIWEGAMVAQISGACVTGTTASAGPCIGIAESDMLGGASDGAKRISIVTDKIFILTAGTNAPTDATPYGTVLYMETDNTVGTGAPGQQVAGRFMGIEDDGKVRVYISNQAQWFDSAYVPNDGGSAPFKARAVITTLQAYDGSGTGTLTQHTAAAGLSAADGVTLVVGDVVFIQAGTTNLTAAKDSGPWQVSALGSASVKWVLVRPSWWQNGAPIQESEKVSIGGEGTVFRGSEWKAMCAGAKVVGTDDPHFYVGRFVEQVTFAGGDNGAHTYAPSVGVLDAAHSFVGLNLTAPGGTLTAVVNYGVDAITPGYTGTATMTLQMYSSTLATNSASSTCTFNVLICNW